MSAMTPVVISVEGATLRWKEDIKSTAMPTIASIPLRRVARATMSTTKEAPMNFNNILIGSEDPKALKDYYSKLFGEPMYSDDAYSTWQIGSGFVSIGPHSEVKGKSAHPGRIIWNIETADVQTEFDRMKAAGAIVIAEPYSFEQAPGSWIATFADPDDNYFQLMTPMPETMGGQG